MSASENKAATEAAYKAFSAGDLLLAPLRDALNAASPDFELREPLHLPHYGAALYAAKLAGGTPGVQRGAPEP